MFSLPSADAESFFSGRCVRWEWFSLPGKPGSIDSAVDTGVYWLSIDVNRTPGEHANFPPFSSMSAINSTVHTVLYSESVSPAWYMSMDSMCMNILKKDVITVHFHCPPCSLLFTDHMCFLNGHFVHTCTNWTSCKFQGLWKYNFRCPHSVSGYVT